MVFFSLNGTPGGCFNFWQELIQFFITCRSFILYQNSWKTLLRDITSSVRIRWARSDGKSRQQQHRWLGTSWEAGSHQGWPGSPMMPSGTQGSSRLTLWSSACGLVSLSLLPYRHHTFTQLCPVGGSEEANGVISLPLSLPLKERDLSQISQQNSHLSSLTRTGPHPPSWINLATFLAKEMQFL